LIEFLIGTRHHLADSITETSHVRVRKMINRKSRKK